VAQKDLDELGGLGGLAGAIAMIVLGLFAAFWPDRWNQQHHRTHRRLVTIGALASYFFGSQFIKNALKEASWWTVVWVLGGIAIYIALLLATTMPTEDEAQRVHGTPRRQRVRGWLSGLRQRLFPRQNTSATTGP
jgi:MFS family permease